MEYHLYTSFASADKHEKHAQLLCMVAQKLRKNGIPKRSGLQEGDRRASRALSLKLQVIDEYRMRQRQKVNGQCCAPLDETARKFNVHKSLVSKWAAKEEELRCVVAQASATRFSLHPGSKCRFPLAEADTHAVYELSLIHISEPTRR